MTFVIKKFNNSVKKNWNLSLSFLFPFLLFLPVALGYKHFPYDFQGYNFPLLDGLYQEILNPESFLWDQYTYGGISLTSNPQQGLFYPLNMILIGFHLLFGAQHLSSYWYGILGIIQYSIFALCSSLFIFELCKSRITSLIGSVQITTLGIVIANVQHPGITGSFILLPLILQLILKVSQTDFFNVKSILLLVFCFSFTLSSGHFPQAGSTIISSLIFALVLSLYSKKSIKLIFSVGISLLFAILLNSPVILSVIFDSSRSININPDWPVKNYHLFAFNNPFVYGLLSNSPEYDPTKVFMWSGFLFLPLITAGYAYIIFYAKQFIPLIITSLITFILGLGSFLWHPNLSNYFSYISVLRGYNIFLSSLIINGFVLTLGLHFYIDNSKRISKNFYKIIFLVFFVISIFQTINYFTNTTQDNYLNPFILFLFIQTLIYGVLAVTSSAKVKTKKILTSIIILVSPLLVSERAKFIMGHAPSISSNNVRNIGGDKPLQDFMRNLDTQGLIGYNTRRIEGDFNAFMQSWKLKFASGHQPQVSKDWYDIGRKLSDHSTNRRFDFSLFGDIDYPNYSIKYYITRNEDQDSLDKKYANLIYEGYYYNLYEIKDSLPLYRIRKKSKNNEKIEAVNILKNGKSDKKYCFNIDENSQFEAVGIYDKNWEVYFNGIKMSKDMTKKGIGVYKISNENKNRCGEIKLNYFDKYFISGLIIKLGTLSSLLLFYFKNLEKKKGIKKT